MDFVFTDEQKQYFVQQCIRGMRAGCAENGQSVVERVQEISELPRSAAELCAKIVSFNKLCAETGLPGGNLSPEEIIAVGDALVKLAPFVKELGEALREGVRE